MTKKQMKYTRKHIFGVDDFFAFILVNMNQRRMELLKLIPSFSNNFRKFNKNQAIFFTKNILCLIIFNSSKY